MLIPDLEENLRTNVLPQFGEGYYAYCKKPGIYYMENFLSDVECDYVKAVCKDDDAHSVTELGVDKNTNNCYTWRISIYGDEIIKNIANKLAFAVSLPTAHAERLEVRRFDNMGFYNKMCDYIDDDDHASLFGSCKEFPELAWEELDNNSVQFSPRGRRLSTAITFLSEHDSVKLIFKNINKPHVTPQKGMTMIHNVDTNQIVYDVSTNFSEEPFWMMKLMFREEPRRVHET